MLEEFTILEQKVKSLIDSCEALRQEKKSLKESLEKSEKDMYALIDENDSVKRENEELKNKLKNYEQDERIKLLINKIDGAISNIEGSPTSVPHTIEENINKENTNKKEDKQPEEIKENISQIETQKPTQEYHATNEKNNEENKNIQIHISEEEDPFSNASDASWDEDIKENIKNEDNDAPKTQNEITANTDDINDKNKPSKEENSEKYEFNITEEEDEYIFGDDSEEDDGFFFDEESK